MYTLETLLEGGHFAADPEAGTRIAFIHRSFRSVGLSRGLEESFFKAHFPALGLLNLAQAVRTAAAEGRIPPVEVRYFDEDAHPHEVAFREAISDWLDGSARPVIAASSYTGTIDRLEDFLGSFAADRYLVMVGGAHASVAPDIDNVHMTVRGEGAPALLHVLSTFGTPSFGQGAGTRGLHYRTEDRQVVSPPCFDRSLQEAKGPAFAYDLLPPQVVESPVYATNFTRMLGDRPQLYICTQSCRGRCTFCSTYLIHGRTVARPLRLVRNDLEDMVRTTGCDSVEFHDDDLTQHPEFDELVEVMGELGLPWFCYLRVDGMSAERARRMAAAGCRRAFVGLESMDQAVLDYYNKQVTVEQNRSAIAALAEAGINCVTGFIIGAPQHTVEKVVHEMEEFLNLPLYAMSCTILSPDPATVEFVRAKKAGHYGDEVVRRGRMLRLVPNVEKYGLASPVGLPTVCEGIGKADLNRLQAVVDARFYFREHVWQALTAGRTAEQVQVVSDYYRHLLRRLDDPAIDLGREDITALVRDARQASTGFSLFATAA
ncbi:B12-binding domain-containing radical SAM protein [Streptomyces sp. NPDC055966]|uniref:B12-binding domain-containing radical SAM protein n=1 Tax=Streptomyces sp. NPDC055966 TaxID=3345669 RepID=UPI0035E05F46